MGELIEVLWMLAVLEGLETKCILCSPVVGGLGSQGQKYLDSSHCVTSQLLPYSLHAINLLCEYKRFESRESFQQGNALAGCLR